MFYDDAARFIMGEFEAKTHDKESKLDIRSIVLDRLIKENDAHDPEYYGMKKGEVHVSSLYSCQRGLLMKMLCIPEPEKTEAEKETEGRKLGVFKAGHLFEDFILDSLGDLVVNRQVEYRYQYKGITLVGRSDGHVRDGNVLRVNEVKSVNSNAFWHREKRGELCAWHNQIQLQTYLWLERELNGNDFDGVFTYISKDDCTIVSVPVKYNPDIIEKVVKPTLDALAEAYRVATTGPVETAIESALCMVEPPNAVVFDPTSMKTWPTGHYKENWLATYCPYHALCVGKGWQEEAKEEAKRMNKSI